MAKLRRRSGESLLETLVSMLVIALGMLMLAGAVFSAARMDSRSFSESQTPLQAGGTLEPIQDGWTVTVEENGNP